MISCPYCGGEIPEDTPFCPLCRSMLITEPEPEEESSPEKGVLSKLTHPWSAAAIIFLISVILFFLFRGPSLSSTESEAISADRMDLLNQKTRSPAASVKNKELKEESDEKAEFYAEILEYENTVNSLFEKAKQLIAELETLQEVKPGDEDIELMGRKIKDVRPLLSELRGIKPPRGLERCQTALVNSMSMIQKAIKSEMMYLQTRQNRYLESAKQEQDSASKQKAYALEIIDMVKAKNAPPPPPPEEEVSPEELEEVPAESPVVEPASTSTVEPAEPGDVEIQEGEGEELPESEELEEEGEEEPEGAGEELEGELEEEMLEEEEAEGGGEEMLEPELEEGGSLELEWGSTSEELLPEESLEEGESEGGF
jgi:hypothetical protein